VLENARVWRGARLFVCVDVRGVRLLGEAVADALRLALEAVLVLPIEPRAAGVLDLGKGSRERGLGMAEGLAALCGCCGGGDESILSALPGVGGRLPAERDSP
jgi:hypothetical protein